MTTGATKGKSSKLVRSTIAAALAVVVVLALVCFSVLRWVSLNLHRKGMSTAVSGIEDEVVPALKKRSSEGRSISPQLSMDELMKWDEKSHKHFGHFDSGIYQ